MISRILQDKIDENIHHLEQNNYNEITWRYLKRACKDKEIFIINDDEYILDLSEDKKEIYIALNMTDTDDEHSIELNSDDDWISDDDDEYDSDFVVDNDVYD